MEAFKCQEQHLSSSYNYKAQIQRQLMVNIPSSIVTTANAGKVIRTASSILRLNLLECALLGWLLKHSSYSLNNLTSSANNISLFEEDQNKELLLLILLNAYYVKSYLNKEQPPQIDADVICMIPQFVKVYKSWRPDTLLKDASLAELNHTFNGWTLPPKRAKPDYNQYVNKILELSKTYNTVNTEEEPPAKKKRKVNEVVYKNRSPIKESEEEREVEKNQQQQQPKNEMNPAMNQSMWFKSSGVRGAPPRMHEQIYEYDPQYQQQSDGLRKSTRMRSMGYNHNYISMDLFDLENSRVNFGLNSIFGHSLNRTNSRGLFGEEKHSVTIPNVKRTSSFDENEE